MFKAVTRTATMHFCMIFFDIVEKDLTSRFPTCQVLPVWIMGGVQSTPQEKPV